MADFLGLRVAGKVDDKAAGGGGTAASQATVDAGTNNTEFVTPLTLRGTPTGLLKVKNTAGSTAAVNDAGYLDSAGEYKTTTTAGLDVAWCVVITGGANNADIYVARRGRVTVNYTGTAPSAGHFLTTSTVAGSALRSTTMHPAIFAVCVAAGAGGTVEALLLTGTAFVFVSSATRLYSIISHSNTKFVATINGTPTSTSVVYNAPSSGDENVIAPQTAGQLGKAVLWNTTRGTSRLIDDVSVGANNIVTFLSVDAWASGDTITIDSQTVVSDNANIRFIEVDLSQAGALAVIPALARAIRLQVYKLDSGAAGSLLNLHTFETYAASRALAVYTQASSIYFADLLDVPLINRKFVHRSQAQGAATAQTILEAQGYYLAIP